MSLSRTLSFWRQGRLLAKAGVSARLSGCAKYGPRSNSSVLTLIARLTTSSEKLLKNVSELSDKSRSSDDGSSSSDDGLSSSDDSSSSGFSSSDEGSSSSSSNEDLSSDEQRTSMLEASLKFVPELGWGAATLTEGAKLAGFPGAERDVFPRGAGELIDYFENQCNGKLVDFMKQQLQENEMKAGRLLQSSVEQRLRMIIPFMEKWPQAMALKALPPNISSALENLALMVDDMWYHAGDRSTDIKWYTTRALLTAVYSSTELYMIQDSSVDFEETWKFLDNRMEDTKAFGKTLNECEGVFRGGVEVCTAGVTMARNMAGLNEIDSQRQH